MSLRLFIIIHGLYTDTMILLGVVLTASETSLLRKILTTRSRCRRQDLAPIASFPAKVAPRMIGEVSILVYVGLTPTRWPPDAKLQRPIARPLPLPSFKPTGTVNLGSRRQQPLVCQMLLLLLPPRWSINMLEGKESAYPFQDPPLARRRSKSAAVARAGKQAAKMGRSKDSHIRGCIRSKSFTCRSHGQCSASPRRDTIPATLVLTRIPPLFMTPRKYS